VINLFDGLRNAHRPPGLLLTRRLRLRLPGFAHRRLVILPRLAH
jgi:hypothetical protein